jgi:hypothetical protein
VRADYKRLQHYKGIAVGLSHRLGLHQSQKRFSFGALTTETRKKVFWTLYTLDWYVSLPVARMTLGHGLMADAQFLGSDTRSSKAAERRRHSRRVPGRHRRRIRH